MNKVELKNKIFIEGFNTSKEMVREQIGRNKELEFRTTLYEGKTSEISEELAKECVLVWFFGKEFDSFEDYNNRSNGFNTAKESIQSACQSEYCIIYKIY